MKRKVRWLQVRQYWIRIITTQADLVGYISMVPAGHPLTNGTLQKINNTLENTPQICT